MPNWIHYGQSICGDKCTLMHAFMHYAFSASYFMHGSVCILQDANFEVCLNKIDAWGQKLWTIAISFWGAFGPSPGDSAQEAKRTFLTPFKII